MNELKAILTKLGELKEAAENQYDRRHIGSAMDSLERVIPRTAERISKAGSSLQGWCPRCGQYILRDYSDRYSDRLCYRCGQRIDWGEEGQPNEKN